MQYEGGCARSKGDSSYPNLLPPQELPLILRGRPSTPTARDAVLLRLPRSLVLLQAHQNSMSTPRDFFGAGISHSCSSRINERTSHW